MGLGAGAASFLGAIAQGLSGAAVGGLMGAAGDPTYVARNLKASAEKRKKQQVAEAQAKGFMAADGETWQKATAGVTGAESQVAAYNAYVSSADKARKTRDFQARFEIGAANALSQGYLDQATYDSLMSRDDISSEGKYAELQALTKDKREADTRKAVNRAAVDEKRRPFLYGADGRTPRSEDDLKQALKDRFGEDQAQAIIDEAGNMKSVDDRRNRYADALADPAATEQLFQGAGVPGFQSRLADGGKNADVDTLNYAVDQEIADPKNAAVLEKLTALGIDPSELKSMSAADLQSLATSDSELRNLIDRALDRYDALLTTKNSGFAFYQNQAKALENLSEGYRDGSISQGDLKKQLDALRENFEKFIQNGQLNAEAMGLLSPEEEETVKTVYETFKQLDSQRSRDEAIETSYGEMDEREFEKLIQNSDGRVTLEANIEALPNGDAKTKLKARLAKAEEFNQGFQALTSLMSDPGMAAALAEMGITLEVPRFSAGAGDARIQAGSRMMVQSDLDFGDNRKLAGEALQKLKNDLGGNLEAIKERTDLIRGLGVETLPGFNLKEYMSAAQTPAAYLSGLTKDVELKLTSEDFDFVGEGEKTADDLLQKYSTASRLLSLNERLKAANMGELNPGVVTQATQLQEKYGEIAPFLDEAREVFNLDQDYKRLGTDQMPLSPETADEEYAKAKRTNPLVDVEDELERELDGAADPAQIKRIVEKGRFIASQRERILNGEIGGAVFESMDDGLYFGHGGFKPETVPPTDASHLKGMVTGVNKSGMVGRLIDSALGTPAYGGKAELENAIKSSISSEVMRNIVTQIHDKYTDKGYGQDSPAYQHLFNAELQLRLNQHILTQIAVRTSGEKDAQFLGSTGEGELDRRGDQGEVRLALLDEVFDTLLEDGMAAMEATGTFDDAQVQQRQTYTRRRMFTRLQKGEVEGATPLESEAALQETQAETDTSQSFASHGSRP